MSSARLSHRSMSIKTVLKIISQEPSSLIICRRMRGVPAKEWIEINVESLMDFRNQNKGDK